MLFVMAKVDWKLDQIRLLSDPNEDPGGFHCLHMYAMNNCIETMNADIRLFPVACLYEDNQATTVGNPMNYWIKIEMTDKVPASDVQR